MRRDKRAFTILELLVVIAIIAILAIIAVPQFVGAIEKSRAAQEVAEINSVEKALKLYYIDHGVYPTMQGDQPTFGDPKNVRFSSTQESEGLYPKYLASLPHFSYWYVDYQGKAYHEEYKLGSISENIVTLTPGYIYKLYDKSGSLIESPSDTTVELNEGEYLVPVDNGGKELPALTIDFKGVIGHPEANEEEEEPTPETTPTPTPEPTPTPMPGEIAWSGALECFDGNLSTSVGYGEYIFNITGVTRVDTNHQTITWDGDITNRAISITAYGTGSDVSYGASMKVVDVNNTALKFRDVNTGVETTEFRFLMSYGKITKKIVIPAGAKKIVFFSGVSPRDSIAIYEIAEEEDYIIPSQVINVQSTPTDNKITLSWTKPVDADFSRVLIYRNNVYVGSSSTTSFVDTPLMANTSYTYRIHSVDTSGNMSDAVTHTKSTLAPAIVWSSSSAYMFDDNISTSAGYGEYLFKIPGVNQTVGDPIYITWTGDLTDKAVDVTAKGGGSNNSYGCIFKVLDAGGHNLTFKDASTNVSMTTFKYTMGAGVQTKRFIIPAGANRLAFVKESSRDSIAVYEIQEVNQ